MKTKFYWVALLASAAMIAQAKAGGHYGGGGGGRLCHGRASSSSTRCRSSIPVRCHAVILAADATSRLERASHRTMRRRRFVNRALLLLIARLRAVASLQLEPPLVASMDLEQLLVEKPVSHETGMISGIVSRTAVQTSGASMSLRDAQPIGIAIGTGAVIIGGMDIVATSSTASGSSTTRDSIRTIIGIRTAMATATTDPLTIRMTTIPAFMKAARRLLRPGRLRLIGAICRFHGCHSPGAVSATRLLPGRNRRHLRRGNSSGRYTLSKRPRLARDRES